MAKSEFNPKHEAILKDIMSRMPHVSPGSMFGFPGYKVNGKLAVGLYKTGIIAKVGPARTQELVGKDGIELFEPMPGRAWKDWVLLTGNFEQNRSIFEEAVEYVLAETTG